MHGRRSAVFISANRGGRSRKQLGRTLDGDEWNAMPPDARYYVKGNATDGPAAPAGGAGPREARLSAEVCFGVHKVDESETTCRKMRPTDLRGLASRSWLDIDRDT
jgi:hypothetical protein